MSLWLAIEISLSKITPYLLIIEKGAAVCDATKDQ